MSEVLVAIDGNSLVHRAYWAIRPMTTSGGRPTHAVYGFFRMLFSLLKEYKPAYLAVAFDVHAPTFRHEAYPDYKGGRKPTPDDLIEQIDSLREALRTTGVPVLEQAGFEADDILGTLSVLSPGPNYVVTGDKDALQLITDRTTVLMTTKGVSEVDVMTPSALMDKYGLAPSQIPDLKGLMGDTSDNLPGIPGVGEKTALKLLHEYGTIPNLYNHIDDVKGAKLREKLIAGRDSAILCMKLATIDCSVPLHVSMKDLAFEGFSRAGAQEVAREFEFRSFAASFRELSRSGGEGAPPKQAEPAGQAPPEPPSEILQIPKEKEAAAKELAEISQGEMLGVYLSDGILHAACGGTALRIPAGQEGSSVRRALAAALKQAAERRMLVAYDLKSLMHELYPGEPPPFSYYADVMVADWVLDPSRGNYRLDRILAREELPVEAAALPVLWERQEKGLLSRDLENVFQNIEMPLLNVLYTMENNGVRVDTSALEELGARYAAQMQELQSRIYELAGTEFNLGSPKQLAEVLFTTLGLPPGKRTSTGYSTDISVLEKLKAKHPVVPLLIEYRAVSKIKNTYIDGLLAAVHDGYLHTTFLQAATATGRLSSTEPNLQNIPIHSELAEEIRRAFAAPEGCSIVSADYSQIELRILADIADDVNLLQAFDSGEDIHARTAAEVLGKAIGDVSKEERSHAKAVNFGIVYGISDFGLAQSTGLSKKEARAYIDKYLAGFPGVQRYMENIKSAARENGYVKTLYGRIRYIPDIRSSNFNLRGAAERAALNMPIQGSAADIMKLAMIRAEQALRKYDAKLVLQVHDELIAYAADDQKEEVARVLQTSMEEAAILRVPLLVNTASGKTWHEAK